MKILSTIFGIVALAATSFSQVSQFTYDCYGPNSYYDLELRAFYSSAVQQPGMDVVTFFARRRMVEGGLEYPTGVVLFGSTVRTPETPFGHEILCIPRTSTIVGWIRDETTFSMPVYNTAFSQGSLINGMYFQAFGRDIGPNGIQSEITNMVGVTL